MAAWEVGRMDVLLVTRDGAEERPVGELPALLARKNALVWVDVPRCDAEAVRVLSEVFGFHPMAVQDCVERNHVPKMRSYADHVFIVLHTPERGDDGQVHHVELDQFIGPNYLVTVHDPEADPEVALRETRAVLARIRSGCLRPVTPYDLSCAIASPLTRGEEAYVDRRR